MGRSACIAGLVRCWHVCRAAAHLSAQHSYTRSEIENGARLYQGSCATCHGAKGDTVRGTALLSGQFQRASTDAELVKIIVSGIPGTAMPPNNYSDLEAGMIVAYLRGAAAGDSVVVAAGDRARGKTLFDGKGKCATCHSESSRMAPSLVGCRRAPAAARAGTVDSRPERRSRIRISASFAPSPETARS